MSAARPPRTPRRGGATPRSGATTPRAAPPATSPDTTEAALAASLLAEVMCGTPRARSPFAAAAPSVNKCEAPPAEEDPSSAMVLDDGDDDEQAWEMECIMARRRLKPQVEGGPPGEWQYLVRWVGKPLEEDRWVPEQFMDPEFLRQDLEAAATERAMATARISAADISDGGEVSAPAAAPRS
jgi:hypothetical protein